MAANDTNGETVVVYKGDNSSTEEYSIFANKKSAAIIDDIIRKNNIVNIDICGLAGDICVAQTLTDGKALYPEIRWRLLEPFSPKLKNT